MSGGGPVAWAAALDGAPPWDPPRVPTVVVVSHPDDEALSMGGLVHLQSERGLPVTVVAVTDGEAAFGGAQAGLAAVRRCEQERSLVHLGVAPERVHRLGLSDGEVGAHRDQIVAAVVELTRPGDLLVAPSRHDVHPDHVACAHAAETVAEASGLALLGSLFWALQWRSPAHLGSSELRTVRLGTDAARARRRAVAEHRSQLTATASAAPVVRPEHLWVHDTDREPFCLERPGP